MSDRILGKTMRGDRCQLVAYVNSILLSEYSVCWVSGDDNTLSVEYVSGGKLHLDVVCRKDVISMRRLG